MKGKAQLILTDPDSGRVIKHVEENNMATNAIQRIFDIPQLAVLRNNSGELYNNFMPIYKYLISGLVMMGNNVDENPDNFMISKDSIFIGSAGSEYTGTLSTRGTLNKSQSGEIENGYRFVWDFAPEKAVGTIHCIGLTNRLFGNGGFTRQRTDGCIMINPLRMDVIINPSIEYASIKGNMLGYLDGDNTMYSVRVSGAKATIYRSRIPDCGEIRLGDCVDSFRKAEVIRQDEYQLPFSSNDYRYWSFDKVHQWLYTFNMAYNWSSKTETVKYCAIDVKTGEIKRSGNIEWSPKGYMGSPYFAVYNDSIYISDYGDMRKFSLTGEQLESFDFGSTATCAVPMISGGIKAAMVSDSLVSGQFYTYPECEPKVYIETQNYLQSLDLVNLPYVAAHSISNSEYNTIYIMLRTDYLATINNLAEPLVKTDRHALQVRYEITNE